MSQTHEIPTRWREEAAAHSPEVRARRRRMLILAALAAVLIGAIIVFLSWLRPLPHADAVALRLGAPPGVHESAWAVHDREALAHVPLFARGGPPPAGGLDGETFERELAGLASRTRAGVLVLHLAGYAECRGGEVVLLPPGAEPTPLRDALNALAANPARHKLLILDLAAPPPDPRRGFLGDDLAAAVPADLDAVPDPGRLTLFPCSPGQTPVIMADAGRSAFSYYLDRGLRGAADGSINGSADGVVTARELAAYVQARVQRWTQRNRGETQTPELYGPDGDFALVSVPADLAPPAAANGPTAYPDWLRDGWAARQRLLDGDDYRAAPASFHVTEALLLEAERDWFDGTDEGRGAENLKTEFARLEKRRVPPPAPDAPSLGAQLAQGVKPDAKAVEEIRAALEFEPTEPAAKGAALVVPPGTLAALKDKSAIDVAATVFGAAADDPDPRPERLRSLDAVLRAAQPEPQFAEAVLLHRLADLAARTDGWPAATVRRALETARSGELVAGDEEAPQVRGLLEAAAQHRYEGETLVFACRGYAATEDADREFQAAGEAYDAAGRAIDVMRQGRKALDRARIILTGYIPYLEWPGARPEEWERAVDAACGLAAQLDAPAADRDTVLRRDQELLRSIDDVETALDPLQRPFDAEHLAALRDRLRRPQAQPAVLREAEAVLATPLPPAAERGPLWEAARALARRLHEETVRLDQAEDPHHAAAAQAVAPPPEAHVRTPGRQALRRARVSLALLRLGGVGASDIQPIQAALAHAEEVAGDPAAFAPAVEAVVGGLRQAWADADARLYDPSQDPAMRERLSWVWRPPGSAADDIDHLPTPQAEVRARRLQKLAEQRADRARYESRDLAALGALPGWLARFYRDVAKGHPSRQAEAAVEVNADRMPLRFIASDAAATTTLNVSGLGSAPPGSEATLRFLSPEGRWFDLAPTAAGMTLDADHSLRLPVAPSAAVPLRVSLRPDHAAGPLPAGFLAEAVLDGLAYHRLVPVSLEAVTDRLEVFVSADPTGASGALDELRLRPAKGRQSFFLFVRNLSGRPRNLTVRLADAGGPIHGGEAKIALHENETLPVRFEAPAAKADVAAAPISVPAPPPVEAELPELKGPLEVRLLDADAGDAVVAVQAVSVAVASAQEYTQVTGVRIGPKEEGAGNRLTVTIRAAPGLSGPPCPVELVLPGPGPDGRRKAAKGTFRGELPEDGGELTLFAEDISVGPGADEEGQAYLTVDGRPRAYVFRVPFRQNGDAVTPRPETRPALRLRAPQAAPSGPKFEVGVETDNAPPAATLEVGFGRFRDGRYEAELVRHFPSPQKIHIGFVPVGPDGALAFEAAVSDWVADFDAHRIVGRGELRARLFDRDGAEIRTAFQPVTLDDAGPEDASFVDPPKRVRKDAPLPLTATARSASGVAQAVFFLGRPVDQKPPPNATTFPARPADPGRTTWTATLPLKADKAGPIDVSVQFINAAGLSSFATTTVELTEGEPGTNDPGKIEGAVHEGALAQANLEVVMRDEKGTEKARVKTNEEGKFVFDGVAPGKYSLSVEKTATKRYGSASVTVEAGKTAAGVEIKLLMR